MDDDTPTPQDTNAEIQNLVDEILSHLADADIAMSEAGRCLSELSHVEKLHRAVWAKGRGIMVKMIRREIDDIWSAIDDMYGRE